MVHFGILLITFCSFFFVVIQEEWSLQLLHNIT